VLAWILRPPLSSRMYRRHAPLAYDTPKSDCGEVYQNWTGIKE